MKDNTQEAFFELLRAGLFPVNNSRFSVNGSVDWSEVYNLASEQSVVGLLAAGIDTLNVNDNLNVPLELKLQIVGEALQIEQQNKAMNEFVAKLIEKLRKEGVYTLLVKGQGVARCYEKPLWRSSGDIDLYLSDDNYKKAKKVLVPLASFVEGEYVQAKHIGLTIDGFVVELHGNLHCPLSSNVVRGLKVIQDDTFFNGQVRSWLNGRTKIFLLSVENDIVYVFTHFLNHFYKEGVGLRQICDWCRLLWTYRGKLDKKALEFRIKQMGLISEWKAFAALAVDWLGMPKEAMPMYDESSRWNKKANRIIDFIMMSGNMGHNRGSWLMEHDSWLSRQFVVRKTFSLFRRIGDLINHARIFPLDSFLFSYFIMKNGVKSAMRGEG